jgi:branched-chain amino acid transport system permease protein
MTKLVAVLSGRSLSAQLLASLVAAGSIAIGVGVANVVGSMLLLTLMVQATINAIFATSLGMLIRTSGVVCFGQASFFGVAIYIVALGFTRLGVAPEIVILLALIVTPLMAFLLGLVIVGIPGIAFAMTTLAVGQALFEFALKARSLTGGDDGFNLAYPNTIFGLDSALFQDPRSMFIICWLTLVVVIFALWVFSRSWFGRIAIAIRENEERARFVGYETKARRAAVLALSAFIAALAGVLFVLYSSYASPDALHWSVSGSILIMVILGGPKPLWGPAFGAILFFFLKDIVGRFTEHWQAMIGVTLIVVTVLIPEGIGGFLQQKLVVKKRGDD